MLSPCRLNMDFGLLISLVCLTTIVVGVSGLDAGSLGSGVFKAKSFNNDCNGAAVVVNGVNGTALLDGTLSINATTTNGLCVWTIIGVKGVLVLAVEERLRIQPDDTITVTQVNNTLLPAYRGKDIGSKLGLIFVQADGDVNVTLALTELQKGTQRVFGVRFSSRSKNADKEPGIPLSVEEHQVYHIPLTNITNQHNVFLDPLPAVRLDVGPKGESDWSDKKLVIEVEGKEGQQNISYTSEDSKSPADSFDLLAKEAGKHMTLSLKNFDYAKSRLTFTVDLVDAFCSDYSEVDNPPEFSLDTNETDKFANRQSLNCLYLFNFKNSPAARLDFSKLHHLLGASDVLTVHAGGQEYNSEITVQLNNQNVQDVSDSLLRTWVASGKVRVSYTSQYFSLGEAVKIKVSPDTVSKVNVKDEIDTKVTDKNLKDPLFVFTAEDGHRARFTPSQDSVPQTAVKLFSSLDSVAVPFAVLPAKIPVSVIVSPTNILRLLPADVNTVALKGKFDSYNGTSRTASGEVDSVVWSSVDSGTNTSSWFIPSRGNGIFELSLQKLALPRGSYLTIDEFSDKTKKIVNITSEISSIDANRGQQIQLPLMKLNAGNSYLVSYSLGGSESIVNQTLVSASVYYVSNPVCGNKFDLKETGDSVLIEPDAYPNLYPLSSNPSDGLCKWMANGASFVHTVFQEFDLKGQQLLTLSSEGFTVSYNVSRKTPPDDILVPASTMFTFASPLIPPDSGKSQSLRSQAGKGFQAIVTSVSCGGYVDITKNSSFSTPGYPLTVNVTRCLWKVENTAGKSLNDYPIIQFSVGSKNKWSDFATLSVYDNPNTRDLKLVNMSNTNATHFNSSLNVIYIEYKLKDVKKPAPGIQFNFTATDCGKLFNDSKPRVCGNTRRCFLQEWQCNGVNDCGDNYDEIHCNSTLPPVFPPPPPAPVEGGVSGWVIVLVIIPMSIGVGVLLTLFGPLLLTRVRGGRYSEFRNFAEDT